jgi:uncharacterized membrane protein
MADPDPGLLPPAAWHHLTEAERRALQAVLRRTPVAQQLAPQAVAGMTAGERLADAVTSRLGSWPFIVVQSLLLLAWIGLNTIAWRQRWDPYPFILLNLALSFQAAFSAPIIMMSQNRQSAKDRRRAEADYAVNLRAELDVSAVHARLDELSGRQWAALLELQRQQLELLSRIETLTGEVHRATTTTRGGAGRGRRSGPNGNAESAAPHTNGGGAS